MVKNLSNKFFRRVGIGLALVGALGLYKTIPKMIEYDGIWKNHPKVILNMSASGLNRATRALSYRESREDDPIFNDKKISYPRPLGAKRLIEEVIEGIRTLAPVATRDLGSISETISDETVMNTYNGRYLKQDSGLADSVFSEQREGLRRVRDDLLFQSERYNRGGFDKLKSSKRWNFLGMFGSMCSLGMGGIISLMYAGRKD